MSRTTERSDDIYRIVTHAIECGWGRTFGPYPGLGVTKRAIKRECYDGLGKQTRLWYVEVVPAYNGWHDFKLKLIDGEWVHE